MVMRHRGLALVLLCVAAGVAWLGWKHSQAPAPGSSLTSPRTDETSTANASPTLKPASASAGKRVTPASPLARAVERLSSGELDALDLLREALRSKRLPLDAMIDIVFIASEAPEVTSLQERLWAVLRDHPLELAARTRTLLDRALAGDDHERAVVTRLVTIPGSSWGRIRRTSYDDDGEAVGPPIPILSPDDYAAVEAIFAKDHTWAGLKAALVGNLGDLGPRALSLIPAAFRYLTDTYAAREAYLAEQAAAGRHVLVNWGRGEFDVGRGVGTLGPAVIPHLLPYLESDATRFVAGIAISSLGAGATPALLTLAREGTVAGRQVAMDALASSAPGVDGVLEALRRGLRDPDEQVRRQAAAGLVHHGDVEPVRHILQGKPSSERLSALQALGSQRDRTLPDDWHAALLACMRQPGAYEHHALFEAAERMGPAAVPATRDLLRISRDHPRLSSPDAEAVIRSIGPASAPHLAAVLMTGDDSLAALAARALLWLPEVPQAERERLATWLESNEASPFAATVAAVIARDRGHLAVRILAETLRDGTRAERVDAAEGLGRTGASARTQVPDLVSFLAELSSTRERRDYGAIVRVEEAIESIGAHDLDAMVKLLEDDFAHDPAVETLKRAGTRGIDALLRGWTTTSPSARVHALPLLAHAFDRAESRIKEALEHDTTRTFAAGILLVRTTDTGLRERVARVLVDAYIAYERPDGFAAFQAMSGRLPDDAASALLPVLRSEQEHPDAGVRKRILDLIGTIEDGGR